jgi:predicted nucleic acid-binding protein
LIRYEVTNALHRLRGAGEISDAAATEALRAALAVPITMHDDAEVHVAAMEFAGRFRLPAAYDAHYLALAERLGVAFWTIDQRLFNTVRHALPWVHLAGQ